MGHTGLGAGRPGPHAPLLDTTPNEVAKNQAPPPDLGPVKLDKTCPLKGRMYDARCDTSCALYSSRSVISISSRGGNCSPVQRVIKSRCSPRSCLLVISPALKRSSVRSKVGCTTPAVIRPVPCISPRWGVVSTVNILRSGLVHFGKSAL